KRLCREQFKLSRGRQSALVQGRAVTRNPGVEQEYVLIDQIQPIKRRREVTTAKEHTSRRRVLEFLHTAARLAGDVVAIGPRIVCSRGRHHILRLRLQLDRPLEDRGWRLHVAARDRW